LDLRRLFRRAGVFRRLATDGDLQTGPPGRDPRGPDRAVWRACLERYLRVAGVRDAFFRDGLQGLRRFRVGWRTRATAGGPRGTHRRYGEDRSAGGARTSHVGASDTQFAAPAAVVSGRPLFVPGGYRDG